MGGDTGGAGNGGKGGTNPFGMGGGAGAGSGGQGGTVAGSGGKGGTSGTGGSTAGTAGKGGTAGSGGSGGSGTCTPPSGTTCTTAVDYCMGYPYMPMDYVMATCQVGTAGCLQGRRMLFRCVATCDTQVPGGVGFVDTSHWSVAGQCL
jgi:hypothetical protein